MLQSGTLWRNLPQGITAPMGSVVCSEVSTEEQREIIHLEGSFVGESRHTPRRSPHALPHLPPISSARSYDYLNGLLITGVT